MWYTGARNRQKLPRKRGRGIQAISWGEQAFHRYGKDMDEHEHSNFWKFRFLLHDFGSGRPHRGSPEVIYQCL